MNTNFFKLLGIAYEATRPKALVSKPPSKTPTLDELLEKARHHVMTEEEKQAQRESWVRGEMGLSELEEGMTIRFPPTPAEIPEECWKITHPYRLMDGIGCPCNKCKEEEESSIIFGFGSNVEGWHSGGAAATALEKYGAVWGKGEGLFGSSYALPTMDVCFGRIGPRLPLSSIKRCINNFILFAAANPQKEFHMTRIGCGIAGYTDQEIAPLFNEAGRNVLFDSAWEPYLDLDVNGKSRRFWGTF